MVPNLYPALEPARRATADGRRGRGAPGASEAAARLGLFSAMPATGAHEVIVNAPASVTSLAELPAEQVALAMEVWRERMREHTRERLRAPDRQRAPRGGRVAAAHPRAAVRARLRAGARSRASASASARTRRARWAHNLLGDLVAEEVRRRERIVAIDDEAVLIAPYASSLPFQLMLAPRRPRARFEDDGPTGARLLHDGAVPPRAPPRLRARR